MKFLDKALLIGAIGASVLSGCKESKQKSKDKQAELLETLTTVPDPSPIPLPKNAHLSKIKDLGETPFSVEKKVISKTFGDLLGYSQAETIIRDFNTFSDTLSKISEQNYHLEDSIQFPLIYPELEHYFPQQWETLVKHPAFEKYQEEKTEHLLIVSQCDNGKNALAYYHNGELKLATYISIGTKNRKTISGKFTLKHDRIFRRSRKYKNAPMPYAIQITGGYFLHQGWSDGKPRSHGCIRVPGLYQKWLYEHLPSSNESEVVIDCKSVTSLGRTGNEQESSLVSETKGSEGDSLSSPAKIILEGLYIPTLSLPEKGSDVGIHDSLGIKNPDSKSPEKL